MLLMLLERGEPVADITFFDTGWEFPEMYEHLEQLEIFTGLKITRLHPRLPVDVETEKTPFDWMFSEYPVVKRGTRNVHQVGRGWPAATRNNLTASASLTPLSGLPEKSASRSRRRISRASLKPGLSSWTARKPSRRVSSTRTTSRIRRYSGSGQKGRATDGGQYFHKNIHEES